MWTAKALRWAHMPFCWFCHEAAHLDYMYGSPELHADGAFPWRSVIALPSWLALSEVMSEMILKGHKSQLKTKITKKDKNTCIFGKLGIEYVNLTC